MNASASASAPAMMGHEAEIIIPGSFVVLQGTPGDGVANTIDTPPPFLPADYYVTIASSRNNTTRTAATTEGSSSSLPASAAATTVTDEDDDFMDAEEDESSSSASSSSSSLSSSRAAAAAPPPPTVAQLAARNTTLGGLTAVWGQQPCTNRTDIQTTTVVPCSSSSLADSFVVVSEHEEEDHPRAATTGKTTTATSSHNNNTNTKTSRTSSYSYRTLSPTAQNEVDEWNRRCRQLEVEQKREWQENVLQTLATAANTSNTAFTSNHTTTRTGIAAATTRTTRTSARHPMEDHLFWRRRDDFWWLTPSDHKIAILRDIPTQLSNGTVLRSVIGSLCPGSTIVATEIVYLDSRTLQRVQVPPMSASGGSTVSHRIFPRGRMGWITLVKVDVNENNNSNNNSNCERTTLSRGGYAVLNIDGYPLLAPGLPSLYTDPECWIWRVTCPAGAYVREGLDLNTHHLETLPYGSLVRVASRTMNSQGLCRLRVSAIVEVNGTSSSFGGGSAEEQDLSTTTTTGTTVLASAATSPTTRRRSPYHSNTHTRIIDGWCSEFLNPLSGNRGSVLIPLSFPVPSLYQVTLPMGAVIRSSVELSTAEIGTLERGAIVPVVGRAFSEHPVDHCLERLKLASGGWISVRLNRPPPQDEMIVQARDVDSNFDPEIPALYHWKHVSSCSPEDVRELSSVDSDAVSSRSSSEELSRSREVASPRSIRSSSNNNSNDPSLHAKCLICLSEERNATIVHGETGHVACCLVCARILKARGDKCPVCRLSIDLVIQQFWA